MIKLGTQMKLMGENLISGAGRDAKRTITKNKLQKVE